MGAPYSWHSGARGLAPRWPLTPPLLADELLSSWLVRTALAHGCPISSLTYAVWPRVRAWTRDLDRGLDHRRLIALAGITDLSVSQVAAATLAPAARSLQFASETLPIGTWPWILALGCRNRSHAGGLQCCPECIADQTPHYLIQGRLAWHTACTKHQVQLIDRCPHCFAPLQPGLLLPGASICRCHRCGGPLGECQRIPSKPSALAFQTHVDRSRGHTIAFGRVELTFSEWMFVARVMIGFLQGAARYCSAEAAGFFRAIGIEPSNLQPIATGLQLEYLGPAERAGLIESVWAIMRAGPERFMDLAANASLPASILPIPAKGSPDILVRMASVLKKRTRARKDKPDHRYPRQQREVLRMWLRLQRRMRRNGGG